MPNFDYIVPPNPPVDAPLYASLYDRLGGEAGISRLVKWFYARVRYEPGVEKIFREQVHDWPSHMRTIIDIWSQMTGGPQRYTGGMGRHAALGLREEHFAVWLGTWERTCKEVLPEREANEMIALADNLGLKLRQMSERTRES